MYQLDINPSTFPAPSVADLDEALREKIDAAVGGPVHVDTAVVIDEGPPRSQIVVVVVQRLRWPSDDELRRLFRLTPRESEVARLLADRFSDEEIAGHLDIRLNTARCHSHRVLGKLGVHSRNDVRTALLDPDAVPEPSSARNVA